MSDGITDAARIYKIRALKEAREKYPSLEIIERDWTKFIGWEDKQKDYLFQIVREIPNTRKCGQCKGVGKEKVVLVKEKWIEHTIEEIDLECRKCYGIGLVRISN